MIMDIGLAKKDRKLVSDALSRVLADTFILYMKAHSFHWNVTGLNFKPLHEFFEEIYKGLIEDGDEIAERIRSLGHFAPASFSEFTRLTAIKDETTIPESVDMIRQLTLDLELLIRRMKEVVEVAESVDDMATGDLMIQQVREHTKTAWMLRSHLE
jgi:starvation-inducible DNA-binding protein